MVASLQLRGWLITHLKPLAEAWSSVEFKRPTPPYNEQAFAIFRAPCPAKAALKFSWLAKYRQALLPPSPGEGGRAVASLVRVLQTVAGLRALYAAHVCAPPQGLWGRLLLGLREEGVVAGRQLHEEGSALVKACMVSGFASVWGWLLGLERCGGGGWAAECRARFAGQGAVQVSGVAWVLGEARGNFNGFNFLTCIR